MGLQTRRKFGTASRGGISYVCLPQVLHELLFHTHPYDYTNAVADAHGCNRTQVCIDRNDPSLKQNKLHKFGSSHLYIEQLAVCFMFECPRSSQS
jgi:hypothetical protein